MAASKRKADTDAPTDAPDTDAPTDEIAPVLVLPASLAEESEHEEITRARRVYVDEIRATDENGNVFVIQRESRADGTQGPREIAKVIARNGEETRSGLRYLAEYGGAARAFRGAGAYVFPRFLDDLGADDLGALLQARESES